MTGRHPRAGGREDCQMTTSYCPVAVGLLARVQQTHRNLSEHTAIDARTAAGRGLAALYETLAAGVDGLSDEQLLATPSADQWSIAEVLEHLIEHDSKYDEFRRLGVEHYVEHGLEHALQLWRLRLELAAPSRENGQ